MEGWHITTIQIPRRGDYTMAVGVILRSMYSKSLSFSRHYPVLALVVFGMVMAIVLQLFGQTTLAAIILTGISLFATLPIVKDMIHTVRQGGYGLDILALVAILVSLALGEYWTAIIIVLMLTGGEALEDYAAGQATRELKSLLERAPSRAHLMVKGMPKDILVASVKPGDRLLVKPGEIIPVDGVLVDGHTNIDESSITGESLPIAKQVGQQVLSGTINLDVAITITASKTSKDSQYAQIVKLVQAAINSKAPFVRLADRYSIPFTVISFAIAGAVWAITGDARRFLEVIVVATPCPLLIGAPIAIISGMSRAAKHGIIIKNGATLERLAATKSIAFDKTGTLTKGQPTVDKVIAYDHVSQAELLGLAAAVEQNSAHILAKTVVSAAKKQRLTLPEVSNVRETQGFGLEATWQHQRVLVGKLAFMEQAKISLPPGLNKNIADQTTAFIAIDHKLVGALTFIDELRAESPALIADLQAQGIQHISMLTGDNQATAQHIADKLNIKEIHANLLPADKVRVLKEIPAQFRPSAMVGDGVNDAPVLAASDVGIALGARGSTAASESADIVIMLDQVERVSLAIKIAKNTIHIGTQSILAGIAMSVGLMLIFATGKFKPVVGAAVQELVDVVVIFNALRAHGGPQRVLQSKLSNSRASRKTK